MKNNSVIEKFILTFPETPDDFKKSVKDAIDYNLYQEQQNGKKASMYSNKIKMNNISKVAVAAMAILLIGGPVYAFGFAKISQHLYSYGYNVPEEMISTENKTVSDEYLIIDEAYIDGTFLAFTAHLPEGAVNIPFASSDHVYVNGQNCLLEQFEQGSEEPGSYFCLVNLVAFKHENNISDILLEDKVVVQMDLCMNDSWEKIPFEFETTIDKTSIQVTDIPEQTIEIENGIVAHVVNSTIVPSAILLNLKFDISGECGDELSNKYTSANYYVEDSKGNRKLLIDANGAANFLQCGINWFAEINDFDMDSEYIKMIPYTVDYDKETGKEILGTEKIDEEHAFIIRLK